MAVRKNESTEEMDVEMINGNIVKKNKMASQQKWKLVLF